MKLSRIDPSSHPPSAERQAGGVGESTERIRAVEATRAAENDARSTGDESEDKRPMAEILEADSARLNAQLLAEQLTALGKEVDTLIHPEALHNPLLHVLDDSA